MEHNVYCTLLEQYCLNNRLDEGVLSGLSNLSDAVLGVFKSIGQYVRKIATKLGVPILSLVNALKQKEVFEFLKSISFNFTKVLDYLKQAYNLLKGGVESIFVSISKSGVIQQLKSGAMKIDDLMAKYPILKKLTGPVLAGLLLYMWINSSFTGDVGDDFDISNVFQALSGKFTLADLFLSPAGLKSLALFSTGSLLSFPYMFGTFPTILIAALVLTGYKKLKSNPDLIKKIQTNVKSLVAEHQIRMEVRQIISEIVEEVHVYQNSVGDLLKTTKRGTPIYFTKHGEDHVRKAYYAGFRNGAHWVNYVGGGPNYNSYQNDVRVYPSRDVEIKKIGNDSIESSEDFQDRIDALKQIEKEKKGKELNQMYKDAYRQSKLYPNID